MTAILETLLWNTFFGTGHLTYKYKWYLIEICSSESNWWKFSIGQCNELVPNRRETIIQTNVDTYLGRHMTSLGHDELKKKTRFNIGFLPYSMPNSQGGTFYLCRTKSTINYVSTLFVLTSEPDIKFRCPVKINIIGQIRSEMMTKFCNCKREKLQWIGLQSQSDEWVVWYEHKAKYFKNISVKMQIKSQCSRIPKTSL